MCGLLLLVFPVQIHVGHRTWTVTGWKPVSEEIIKEGLQLVLDVNRHPIMVMCT